MKSYEALSIEFASVGDVISTSSEVITGGVQLPWGDGSGQAPAATAGYSSAIGTNYEI